jgi:probable rRNA maturation factor
MSGSPRAGAESSPSSPERRVEVAVDGIRVPRWTRRFSGFCARVLAAAGFQRWDVSVLLCGDERMAALNERYRGKKGPTDVLSFLREEPGDASGVVAGDLALSLEMLRRNAAAFECTEEEELKRLAVHGILHLAGMDHGRGRGGRMLALQERLLKQLEAERIVGGQKL